MIVIGADTHKSSHTFAAVDAATGKLVAARTVAADEAGQRAALSWARRLGAERVWAIEDCRHVSGRLARARARRCAKASRRCRPRIWTRRRWRSGCSWITAMA